MKFSNAEKKDPKKQEERYVAFLESLVGFSSYTNDSNAKDEFINQLNLAWLYCPDHILHKCYEFTNAVHGDTQTSNNYRLRIVSELVLCLRMELYGKRTKIETMSWQWQRTCRTNPARAGRPSGLPGASASSARDWPARGPNAGPTSDMQPHHWPFDDDPRGLACTFRTSPPGRAAGRRRTAFGSATHPAHLGPYIYLLWSPFQGLAYPHVLRNV